MPERHRRYGPSPSPVPLRILRSLRRGTPGAVAGVRRLPSVHWTKASGAPLCLAAGLASLHSDSAGSRLLRKLLWPSPCTGGSRRRELLPVRRSPGSHVRVAAY